MTLSVERIEGEYVLCRGGRALRTPGGETVRLPLESMAASLLRELEEAGPRATLGAGPVGRLAALALDRVRPARETFFARVLAYGNADLLAYRASSPPELVRRQEANWDPILHWAETELGARLRTGVGVVPFDQDGGVLQALGDAVRQTLPHRGRDFALAATGEMTTLSGSLLLAMATARGRLSATEAWSASTVDEDWQSERWGADAEAVAALDRRRRAYLDADRLFGALTGNARVG